MFGFGMSAIDKAILRETEQMLEAFALVGVDAKPIARKLFDDTKAEMLRNRPHALYDENIGDRLIISEYVKPRRQAGLVDEDILEYWNRPALLVTIGVKLQSQFIPIIFANVAEQQGRDVVEFARERRRKYPHYGDPELWDQRHPVNEVFTAEDADIYPEFIFRVGRWQQATPEVEQARILANYTSFNAMVRSLIAQRLI